MNEAAVVNLFFTFRVFLVGGILLALPRIARKGLVFGTYLGEEQVDGAEVAKLRRSWDLGTAAVMAFSLLVGWTTIGESRELQAEVALVADSGLQSALQLPVDSMTVGVVQLADTGGVIALVADGVGGQELILAFPIKPPNEPPLLRTVSVAWIDSGIDTIHEAVLALEPTVHEVDGPAGPSAVLTWWPGESELAFVSIGPDASVSTVETLEHPGKAVHPHSLIGKALRASR